MKVMKAFTKALDWTGVDNNAIVDNYYYISDKLDNIRGTKLPKELEVELKINLFEPKDIVLENLGRTVYTDGVETNTKVDLAANGAMPCYCPKDLTFFNSMFMEPYYQESGSPTTAADLDLPDYIRYQYTRTIGKNLPLFPIQYKKKVWESGVSYIDNKLTSNGKMLSMLTTTKDEPYYPQVTAVYYVTTANGGPEISDNDIDEGEYTYTTASGNIVIGRKWKHDPEYKIYYGKKYGEGTYMALSYANNWNIGLQYYIELYAENNTLLGTINYLPDTVTIVGLDKVNLTYTNFGIRDYRIISSNIAFGISLNEDNELDNIYALVNIPTPGGKGAVDSDTYLNNTYYAPLKTDIANIFGPSSITYEALAHWLTGASIYTPGSDTPDPYKPVGPSGPGGGNGSWDYTSDPIAIPGMPPSTAMLNDFITMYSPNAQQLKNFSKYLFSDWWDISGVSKLFNNLLDTVVSFTLMPFEVPKAGVPTKMALAGKWLSDADDVSMYKVTSQYKTIDCGTIELQHITGSYLDYDSGIQLYLPYIGFVPLRPEDVFSKRLNVTYHIDIATGALVCYIRVNDSVMYSYTGQCGAQIPFSSNDYSNMYAGIMRAATTIVGAVASPAPALAALNKQPDSKGKVNVEAVARDKIMSDYNQTMGAVGLAGDVGAIFSNAIKPAIQRSGSMAGQSSIMAIQKPYLIITTPNLCLPEGQKMYQGYPLMATKKLEELTGFTSIHEIHLENIPCTMSELNEIYNLLKGGVIL